MALFNLSIKCVNYDGSTGIGFGHIGIQTAPINYELPIALLHGITTNGSPIYVYPYGYLSPNSLGLSPGSVGGAVVIRGCAVNASIGPDSVQFTPCTIRAANSTSSLGLTSKVKTTEVRAVTGIFSVGLNFTGNLSRLNLVKIAASLGLTGNVRTHLLFARVQTNGSLGITLVNQPTVGRALRIAGGLGISAAVGVLIQPSVAGVGVIYLLEGTDTDSPGTFGAILPRDYQRFFLDQTVSSYPQTFNLLN